MIAVIMAGGKGKRISELTKNEIPKPMLKICGKPILLWQIEAFKENGINDFIIIVGHLKEKILDYFGNGQKFDVNIDYVIEDNPLGTGGSICLLKDKIKEDNFILSFGDTLFNVDIYRMLEFHQKQNADITLFVHPNGHPGDSDLIIANSGSRIIDINRKDSVRDYYFHNCVNAGLYIFNKNVFGILNKPIMCDLEKDIIQNNLETLNIFAYQSSEYIKDIGTVERVNKANEDIKNGIIEAKNFSKKQKAIFIDRDGTLNIFKDLIDNSDDIELTDFAAEAVRAVNDSEYLIILITNQPVVARNLCSIDDVNEMHNKIETLLGSEGAYLDGIYFCPHHPDKGYAGENRAYKIDCECRKPKIGLLLDAQEKFNIDFSNSWFVGDTTIDIQTGVNAGCKTILVKTSQSGQDLKYDVKPTYVATDLLNAVEKILRIKPIL